MREILDAFEGFPTTTFIWCHAGISRRVVVADLIGVLDRVLAAHRNHVLIDLSWVVYPDYVLKNLEAWAALVRKYPDSFVLGSDVLGRFGDYTEQIRIYDALFDAIGDREVIEKLAHGNFLRIAPKEGITLDPNYHYPEDRFSIRDRPAG